VVTALRGLSEGGRRSATPAPVRRDLRGGSDLLFRGSGSSTSSGEPWKVARRPRPSFVGLVVAADAAWVLAAVVVIVGFPDAMTAAGLWALGIVTLAVADFAIFQMIGLRRSTTAV
jgi:hypothetical protein